MIPYKFKYVGWAFFLTGLTLIVLNQIQRIKIKIPVLAVHSSYIQTKYFAVITTNVFEEITLVCLDLKFVSRKLSTAAL